MRSINLLLLLFLCAPALADFAPPVGIPDPSDHFGSFDPIDSPVPDSKTHCPGWHEPTPRANTRAFGDERDSYFIDKNHPAATDTSNPFGHPNRPRLTIPSKVYQAGDFVKIFGDGNPQSLSSTYDGPFDPRGVGTDQKPIWIVGVNNPVLTGKMSLGTSNVPQISYFVFEGIQWRAGGKVEIRTRFENNSVDHIVFRKCKILGRKSETDGFGFNLTTASPENTTQSIKYIVFYDSEIGYWGDPNNPKEEICFNIGYHLNYCWCLDSDIHHAAEDGFLMSHVGKRTSKNIYIGRNNIYENLTNGMDLKGVGGPVVISENNLWGHKDIWIEGVHKSSGSGETCVFHYAGPSSGPGNYLNYPEDVSFLFNRVQGGRMGIATSNCGNLRIIGNTFSTSRRQPTNYSDVPFAIDLRGVKGDTSICHNTIYNCEGSIRIWDIPPLFNQNVKYYIGATVSFENQTYVCINEAGGAGTTGKFPSNPDFWKPLKIQLTGNIISSTYGENEDIKFDGSKLFSESVIAGNNCFYNNKAIRMKNYIIQTSDIEANPLLVLPEEGNFMLSDSSRCIDAAGTISSIVYDDFKNLTGVGIKRDITGLPRPMGSAWDIGAYEFDPAPGSGSNPPSSPKNVEIEPTNGQ